MGQHIVQQEQEPQKIKVLGFSEFWGNTIENGHCMYQVMTDPFIPRDKFEAVKIAIEETVNKK